MRVRTNIILAEDILAKIDALAGEKQKRSIIIETALREYIAREESKAPINSGIEVIGQENGAKKKKIGLNIKA
jgi:metal-responsive CopG/Arc/MetJ family transcriptional regulator